MSPLKGLQLPLLWLNYNSVRHLGYDILVGIKFSEVRTPSRVDLISNTDNTSNDN